MQGNRNVQDSEVEEYEGILDAAVAAAQAAAEVIRDAASGRSTLQWESKGAADFVTEVDRSAERAIEAVIASRYPDARMLGEELTPGADLSSPGLTFVADPLDGTTNFLHGYPQYAVSIGALQRSTLVAGVVLNVTTDDCFTAVAGSGAYLNGERIRTSSLSDPSRALIGTGFPFKQPELLDRYSKHFIAVSRHTAGIRRAGSAALDLADVACGRFDGFWELDLAPWDIAAGILLVREAGGIVSNWAGETKDTSAGPVVAGNAAIHPWLLKTLHVAESTDKGK
ncbi:MAG TPA: inositol monophosphatase family protein [Gemmatimonadaceae bacterium]|nr:inositol monophosphatase family protein [Gemmatimonadaceae bacterium]